MMSQTPLIRANIQLIFSGDEYYIHLIEQISKAQKAICLESYIFSVDPIGMRLLNALARAHSRGVHIRLLVDGFGSFPWMHQLSKECKVRNLPLRIYHPLPFGPELWRQLRHGKLNLLLMIFRRINKRNHRKLAIIDHSTILMGSFNITHQHSETYMKKLAWRDSGLLVNQFETDEDVQIILSAFNHAWRTSRYFRKTDLRSILRRGPEVKKMLRSRFHLNSRPTWRFRLLRALNHRLKEAEQKIYLTNAYFLPRKSILRNLRRAARRGVNVVLLLPEVTDVWFVREASRSLYRRLLKDGVRIFEFQNRVLHAKTLIVDQWATVGSHNMNHRSLMHDLEVEAVIEEPDLLQQLESQWHKDLTVSREITLDEVGKTSWPRRMLGRICYWFRYWL